MLPGLRKRLKFKKKVNFDKKKFQNESLEKIYEFMGNK